MDWNPLGIYEPTKPRAVKAESVRAVDSLISVGSLGGGRATVDREEDVYTSALQVLSPFASEPAFGRGGLNSKYLDRFPIAKLVELLAEHSPDVSRALWDFLRFCNPGHEAKAFKLNSTEDKPDATAQAALDAFIGQLHGPFAANNMVPLDVIIASMNIGIFIRGALCTELVTNKQGTIPLELAVPDPATIKFRRVEDEDRGLVWQMGQRQKNNIFVPITKSTVSYIPIDPLPGKPQGRALAASAVFSCMFLIGLLHDLRRVVAQQGYPRLHISIDFDKVIAMMPKNTGDPEAMLKWVRKIESEIRAAYSVLAPDDAFTSASYVEIKGPVGTLDSSSLKGSEGLISALERFTVRALKTMPFMMGINDSTTETMANRQYDAYIGGISSIQHIVETTLEKQLALALRIQGIQAKVEFRFAKNRASEAMRGAQTEALQIDNACRKRDEGFITQDEAAMLITGKKAALPEPIVRRGAGKDANTTENPEPGTNRGLPNDREPIEVGGVQ